MNVAQMKAEVIGLPATSEIDSLVERVRRLERTLDTIAAWCKPSSIDLPIDSNARCEAYANRLLVIGKTAENVMRVKGRT